MSKRQCLSIYTSIGFAQKWIWIDSQRTPIPSDLRPHLRTSSSKCSDPGLSEKGQRQAEALGHHLAETLAPEAPGSMGRSARLSVSVSVSEPPKGKGRKRRIWTSATPAARHRASTQQSLTEPMVCFVTIFVLLELFVERVDMHGQVLEI